MDTDTVTNLDGGWIGTDGGKERDTYEKKSKVK